jgi:hypothetical protein
MVSAAMMRHELESTTHFYPLELEAKSFIRRQIRIGAPNGLGLLRTMRCLYMHMWLVNSVMGGTRNQG